MKAQDRKLLLRDATLSVDARFLFVLIETWADKDGTNAFPSQERLILASGRDRKWFFKYYKELREKGHVSVRKRKTKEGKWANIYTLSIRPQNGDSHRSPKTGHYQVPITRKGPSDDWKVKDSEAMLTVVRRAASS